MKYVKKDNTTFIPFDGIEEVIDKLPPNIYTVESHPMRGMYLEVYSKNFVINEPKLYGEYPNKIDKIINGFSHVNRNMGVIMSGDKGLGKSLSAKILCNRFLAQGYPIILCDKYLDKLSSLLHSINQTCIVFFDEFDKIFTYQSEINNFYLYLTVLILIKRCFLLPVMIYLDLITFLLIDLAVFIIIFLLNILQKKKYGSICKIIF